MKAVTRWPRVASALAAAVFLAGAVSAQPPTGGNAPVKDLARTADFIFVGTVEEIGVANLSIVEPDDRTAIVRVDRVLEAGGTLDDFTGQAVTVFLSQGPGQASKAGDRRVFFTQVQLLGESLGVAEVGRGVGSPADLERQLGPAKKELARERMAERLATADLVVAGRVVSSRPLYPPDQGLISEHDPLWWEAVLEVQSVLKGRAPEKTVTFWFPSSRDVHWGQVPKPAIGHQGTWTLHEQPLDEDGEPVLAVVEPRDLLSPDEATIAEELVNP